MFLIIPLLIINILTSKLNSTSTNKILQLALHEKTAKYTCDPKRRRAKGLGVWSTER